MKRILTSAAMLLALSATWSEPSFAAGLCASDKDHPKCSNVKLPNGGIARVRGVSKSGGGDSTITIMLVATNLNTGTESRTSGFCPCESTKAEMKLGPGTYDIEAYHSDSNATGLSTEIFIEAF